MLLKTNAMLLKPMHWKEELTGECIYWHGTTMIKVLTTRERNARYGRVFWRLWERIFSHPKLECKVGQELRQRRSDKCTACTVKTNLEIDHAVAKLISDGTIVSSTQCPYLVFTHALVFALWIGPEAEETGTESDRVKIIELNTALRHIDRALKTLAPGREEMEYLAAREDEELFARLADVFRAQTLIANAEKFLVENFKRNHGDNVDPMKRPPVRRGRRPALAILSIVAPCADAWTKLIGKRPGKNNVRFHALLRGAAITVLGRLDREPDWEGQIVSARQRKAGENNQKK
jgi:hypothetical protein